MTIRKVAVALRLLSAAALAEKRQTKYIRRKA